VHVCPQTNEIYLENQYPRPLRRSKAPKYIQFGHKGPWYSCRHHGLDKLLGTERYWRDAKSERDGRASLSLLRQEV